MTPFYQTSAGAAFIATAASRETSPEVMKAIAYVSANTEQGDALWNGDGFGIVCNLSYVVEIATDFGRIDAADLRWGDHTLEEVSNLGVSA